MLKVTGIQGEAQTRVMTVTDKKGSGPLTTRTGDTEGTATLAADHGIETGDTVIVTWDGGLRENVTVGTVSGSSVELTDSGSGDTYPAQDTVITVMRTVNISGATISLWAKRRLDASTDYVFTKADDDFTCPYDSKNYNASVVFTREDNAFRGTVYVIVQFEIAADNVKKLIFEYELTPSPEA